MLTFKDYITENRAMNNTAMWISPSGKMLVFDNEKHIDTIIKNPEAFGYTKSKIESIYKKHNEPVNLEGKAREEIILDVLKKGWIRVRRYRQYWSINITQMTKKTKDVMYDWANKILSGVGGQVEKDKYMPVRIVGNTINKQYTVQDIANDVLYEGEETFDPSNTLEEITLKTFKDMFDENSLTEAFKPFFRLPGNVINNELYQVNKMVASFYSTQINGDDFDEKKFNEIIRKMQDIKKSAKKFNAGEVPPTPYRYKDK